MTATSSSLLQYRSVPIDRWVWAATPINIGPFQCSVNSTPTPGTKIPAIESTI